LRPNSHDRESLLCNTTAWVARAILAVIIIFFGIVSCCPVTAPQVQSANAPGPFDGLYLPDTNSNYGLPAAGEPFLSACPQTESSLLMSMRVTNSMAALTVSLPIQPTQPPQGPIPFNPPIPPPPPPPFLITDGAPIPKVNNDGTVSVADARSEYVISGKFDGPSTTKNNHFVGGLLIIVGNLGNPVIPGNPSNSAECHYAIQLGYSGPS
jgi:hypothetical protein